MATELVSLQKKGERMEMQLHSRSRLDTGVLPAGKLAGIWPQEQLIHSYLNNCTVPPGAQNLLSVPCLVLTPTMLTVSSSTTRHCLPYPFTCFWRTG